MIRPLGDELSNRAGPIVLNGIIGPRWDGCVADAALAAGEAEANHARQIEWLAATDVDVVPGTTFTQSSEAIGLVRAGRAAGMPVVISFTVETDGRLPSGQPLPEAIQQVDAVAGDTWQPVPKLINLPATPPFDSATVRVDQPGCGFCLVQTIPRRISRRAVNAVSCPGLGKSDEHTRSGFLQLANRRANPRPAAQASNPSRDNAGVPPALLLHPAEAQPPAARVPDIPRPRTVPDRDSPRFRTAGYFTTRTVVEPVNVPP